MSLDYIGDFISFQSIIGAYHDSEYYHNIVLTVIESSVRRLVTAMCVNYATNSLQCTRKDYFSFQVTSELQKPKYWPQCLHGF